MTAARATIPTETLLLNAERLIRQARSLDMTFPERALLTIVTDLTAAVAQLAEQANP